jgi:hypothetical protein
MKEWLAGAQGAQEILRSFLRLLTAVTLCSFSLAIVRAQGNASASQTPIATNQDDQAEGEIEIVQQDFKDGRSHLDYSLKQADGSRLRLQFGKEPPTHLLTGDHVRAHGKRSGGSLVLYSGNASVTKTTSSGDATGSTSSSIPVPYTFGTQSTLVILVNFQDLPTQGYGPSDVYNVFFGPVNNFFLENSYGQTSLSGDAVGWYTIPVSSSTCDINQIGPAAQSAATAAGVNLSAYTRYVYFFPYTTACPFAGASNVGGNPSQSWINGTLDTHVIDHELGHAFGLWHSHSLDCGSTATVCSNGNVIEYGDSIDVMGQIQTPAPDFNAYQKERLGWLNYGASPVIQTVNASGTYTINTYETSTSGPNALKILKSTDSATGAKTWYYLEARQALGFDAFLSDPANYTQNETTGVLFHIGTDGNGNSADLLDMTPSTSTVTGWLDMSLAVGQTYQDSAAGVTVTTTAAAGTQATVQITINGSSTPSPPSSATVGVTTNQATYLPGQTVAISVNAFSGTAPVAGASVTAIVTPPAGKPVTLGGTTGSNGVAVLSYKLSRRAAAGTYQVGASANGGSVVTGAVSLTGASSAAATGANASFTVQ